MAISEKRLVPMDEVERTVALKKSFIYEKLDPRSDNYDPDFPGPVRLGRAVRWEYTELIAWIERQLAKRDGQALAANGDERQASVIRERAAQPAEARG